jgi:2,3-bisphosphoglycerate-independent phosphoglycerate mutase
VLEKHLETASEATFPPHLFPGGRRVESGEPILLTQHRADRAKQVAQMLAVAHPFYSLVELDPEMSAPRIFFPTKPLSHGLGFELNRGNVRSIRIAESCKFPHVTRFMNGLNHGLEGRHIRIESVPEATIADHPEMSIEGVVREIETAVRNSSDRLVITNIANLDQVGHLGRYDLAVEAARYVDDALKRILAVCRDKGWTVLVTADHGNADRVTDAAGRPFGSHTDRPVPLIVVPAPGAAFRWLALDGSLVNIAPTVLTILGLPKADYMAASLLEPVTASGLQHSTRRASISLVEPFS